jgi:hypothetical protein
MRGVVRSGGDVEMGCEYKYGILQGRTCTSNDDGGEHFRLPAFFVIWAAQQSLTPICLLLSSTYTLHSPGVWIRQ